MRKKSSYIHTGTAGWAEAERAWRTLVTTPSNHVRFALALAADWLTVGAVRASQVARTFYINNKAMMVQYIYVSLFTIGMVA